MSGSRGRDDGGTRAALGAITSQRVDKWLWFARLAKTRTQATNLVTEGKIRINRERIDKPATALKAGDVVTATVHRRVRVLKVSGFLERRGPADEAVRIYEELTPASERTKSRAPDKPGMAATAADNATGARAVQGVRPAGSGRPTKRDRRRIDAFKDEQS